MRGLITFLLVGLFLVGGTAAEAWLDKRHMDRASALFLAIVVTGMLVLFGAIAVQYGRIR